MKELGIIRRALGYISSKIIALNYYYKIDGYRREIKSDTNNYKLGGLVNITHPENVYIGDNSYINGGEISASKNAQIRIGKNCLISYGVHMRTDMHNYINKDDLINKQGLTEKSIIIGDDVWIGYGVQIMAGVEVACGCVIAAGAVLTKSTEPYCVYGGIPARKIKKRESQIKEVSL